MQTHNKCPHKLCEIPNITGVGALLVNKNYQKDGLKVKHAILLGKERYGQYTGQYNLPGGKIEPSDNACIYAAIKRELIEEFKLNNTGINICDWRVFDSIFKDYVTNKIRYIQHYNTIILVGLLPKGTSRNPINIVMSTCNLNPLLPLSHKEIECVEWFDASTSLHIERKPYIITKYANSVITKYVNNNYFNM